MVRAMVRAHGPVGSLPRWAPKQGVRTIDTNEARRKRAQPQGGEDFPVRGGQRAGLAPGAAVGAPGLEWR
eukprot:6702204-Pyramimonas_sp.AAC.1